MPKAVPEYRKLQPLVMGEKAKKTNWPPYFTMLVKVKWLQKTSTVTED